MKDIKGLKMALLWFLACSLSGCGLEYLPDEVKGPGEEELLRPFNQTILKQSGSADVLSIIHQPKYELLSQSESVVASCGERKGGRKIWLNMVAFDQELLTAKRKYFLLFDENVPYWVLRQKCRIDMEVVSDTGILEKPYANENARRIAVLQDVLKTFGLDALEVRKDNVVLDSCAMVVNQTINGILKKLEVTPAKAIKLSDLAGLAFDHIVLGPGRVRMVIRGDVVKVKVKIGRFPKPFKEHQDVKDM